MTKRDAINNFIKEESSSGKILIASSVLGLLLANLPTKNFYNSFLSWGFTLDSKFFYLSLTSAKVINYLLMAIFFLVVGMEIKREILSGHLSSLKKIVTPFIAALGGMLLPAAIYLLLAGKVASEGWAIPVATDIALALGVLVLAGNRVSSELKTFLLALAVIDDIGAITIIAFFYSKNLAIGWLLGGFLVYISMLLMFRLCITNYFLVFCFSFALWYCFYRSGIHPTISGVLIGFALPVSEKIENRIHPWSSFLILPLFAIANCGIPISLSSISAAFASQIAIGIFFALVIGKAIGILSFTKLFSKLGYAELPKTIGRFDLLATGSAAGIGFTVSIFIAKLAFKDQQIQEIAISAVIFASLCTGLLSLLLFKFTGLKAKKK
jgi:NhaA family Na+:H+ antiporter